jgi:two-component system cell cycle sensor histidine kinase/response regulator CckA
MSVEHGAVSERDLWERLPVALYRTTPDGRILDVNRAFVECFHAPTRESLLLTRAEDLYVDPNDRVRWKALIQSQGIVRDFEVQLRRLDATTFWARETVRPQRTADDQILYEGLIEDITDRRRVERACFASELRYRRLFEAATDGRLILDGKTAEIIDVNPFLCDLLGLSREEVLGRKLWEIGPFKDIPASKANFHQLQTTEYIRYEDLPLETGKGEKIAVEFISNVYPVNGDRVIHCNVRDITERRRLEQQLLQAQKMEAVGRLAGGVAHDFNNLLAVITGYGEIVHRQLAGDDPLKAKVAQILKAAERAAGLTRQLLAFGRKQVLQPKIVDLNAIVSGMEKMLRRVIGEDVELATRPAPDLGSVRADPGQIEQVLMNLAVNARDAMPEGGRITIETRNADLDAEYAAAHPPTQRGPYVLLVVTDTGLGMDAATQAQIFEPFFTTKEVGKGTGLGLSTVYGIVKQSGGFVWVYSEVGVGTTLKIYLPRVDEQAPVVQQERPGPLLRGAETVLLVEDEASLREMLREALEANGYFVLVAQDGAEALQIAEAHAGPIQIMVTDVIMPGMTGPKIVELVEQIRPEMKVLYISGYSDESVVRHGLIGPGRAFLGKPFGPEALLRKVRETLDAN